MNLTDELIESNVKIALFMSWKLDDTFPDKGKVYRSPRNNVELASTLKYHYDWNWIMPVIDKIESMGYKIDFSVAGFVVSKVVNNTYEKISVNLGSPEIIGSRLKAAYYGIVSSITIINK